MHKRQWACVSDCVCYARAPMVDALAFWAVLNGGKDAPNHMKQMGSTSATQKARSAKEGTLKPGGPGRRRRHAVEAR